MVESVYLESTIAYDCTEVYSYHFDEDAVENFVGVGTTFTTAVTYGSVSPMLIPAGSSGYGYVVIHTDFALVGTEHFADYGWHSFTTSASTLRNSVIWSFTFEFRLDSDGLHVFSRTYQRTELPQGPCVLTHAIDDEPLSNRRAALLVMPAGW
jgi:hypothetical protein